MKFNLEIPDEWAEKLDQAAKIDGHSNRSAVIRKAVGIFLSEKSHLSHLQENANEPQNGKEQKNDNGRI